MIIQVLLSWSAIQTVLVFTFSDTFHPSAPPSFASITSNVKLPDTFILCISIQQSRFNDRGFFSILGEDGSEWMSVVFLQYPQSVGTWVIWNKGWYRLGHLTNPKVNFWYHICLEIDVEGNKISASVNGELMGKVFGKDIINTTSQLCHQSLAALRGTC